MSAGVRRVLLMLLAGASGCGLIDSMDDPPVTRTQLSVWNRTEHDLFLVDERGARLDVPACGEAMADDFQLNTVTVRAAEGYVYTFGAPARSVAAIRPMFLVITASPGGDRRDNVPLPEEPVGLPPCQGRPQIQMGQ